MLKLTPIVYPSYPFTYEVVNAARRRLVASLKRREQIIHLVGRKYCPPYNCIVLLNGVVITDPG